MTIGSKDPNGNTATFTYDATFGLFPISATDALGHPTTLERGELPFQIAAAVDANDNRSEFTYDPTGLPATRQVARSGSAPPSTSTGTSTAGAFEVMSVDLSRGVLDRANASHPSGTWYPG